MNTCLIQHAAKLVFYNLIYFIVIPNILFWYVMISYGINRTFINLDYIFVLIISFLFSSYKIRKTILTSTLFIVFFIDVFLCLIQVFTLEHPSDIYFLLIQAEVIPFQFIILFLLLSLYFIAFLYICLKFNYPILHYQRKSSIIVFAITLLLLSSILITKSTSYTSEKNFSSQIINYVNYVHRKQIESQTGVNFLYYPFHSPNYSQLMSEIEKNSQSNKILFVIAESWGYSLNVDINKDILKKIIQNQQDYVFFKQGKYNFNGFTLQGEQRELCSNKVTGLKQYAPITGYEKCIPKLLKKQGYETFSLHGSSSSLYMRDSWYVRAGLDHQYFKKNFADLPICKTFSGKCDTDLMNFIPKHMQDHEKVFFYWMTLNTHFPYEDFPAHSRIQCKNYGEADDSQICHYVQAQADFFDHLAQMLKQPAMRGTDVYVIGDHPPRFGDLNIKQKYFLDQVSWMHLKVKS